MKFKTAANLNMPFQGLYSVVHHLKVKFNINMRLGVPAVVGINKQCLT